MTDCMAKQIRAPRAAARNQHTKSESEGEYQLASGPIRFLRSDAVLELSGLSVHDDLAS
jgi:hypothetical protein